MPVKQVTFSIEDSLKALQKDLKALEPKLEAEINTAIGDAAQAAYASIIAKAQKELSGRRADYLKGLKFEVLGDNSFLISLDGSLANNIEEGWQSYNMVPGLLRSNKIVEVGSRAGSPWVQKTGAKKNKPSHKYAHVPIQQAPFSKAANKSNLADSIKAMTAVNSAGNMQKITSIFNDAGGAPIEGKVAIGRSEDPLVDGLVKYQKLAKNKSGKDTVQSLYITYRTISETGKAWIHPGFSGLKAFDEAETALATQIDAIVKSYFGG